MSFNRKERKKLLINEGYSFYGYWGRAKGFDVAIGIELEKGNTPETVKGKGTSVSLSIANLSYNLSQPHDQYLVHNKVESHHGLSISYGISLICASTTDTIVGPIIIDRTDSKMYQKGFN